MTTIPDHLKGALPRGHKGNALRRERDALILRMSRNTKQIELARQFQISVSSVNYLVNDGKRPQKPPKTLAHVLRESRKQAGHLRECLIKEPVDFVNWLLAETPDGCTIAETMLAIARDAYAEAMEEKARKAA